MDVAALLDSELLWGFLTGVLVCFGWYVLFGGGGADSGGAGLRPHMGQGAGPPDAHDHAPFLHERLGDAVMTERAGAFHTLMLSRRSIRFFSSDPVPLEVVSSCVAAGATAPSGAHCQPWQFLVVKTADVKQQIREAVEEQEKINYEKRMKTEWVDAVGPMVNKLHDAGVSKPYLLPSQP